MLLTIKILLQVVYGPQSKKINFYKSIPLPLWNAHGSIPLLVPWNWRHDFCLHRNIDVSISRMQNLFLKFPAPHWGQDETCYIARFYLELL